VTQLTLDGLSKTCALTTHGFLGSDVDTSKPHSIRYGGPYGYRAVCACGWESEQTAKGHEAAGLWIKHSGSFDDLIT
jgi:hypothetical protein